MSSPLRSLIQSGTKLWLDSIDPELVIQNRELGATGATSNPIIVSDLIETGRFDDLLAEMVSKGLDDDAIAWAMTDHLVKNAQKVFLPIWEETQGNDGYVSFELDPLIEDTVLNMPHDERVKRYIELGKKWSAGHQNRMIKVPATPAGIDALEELASAGITLNVTLIFTPRQYEAARDAVWKGAQKLSSLDHFKSVYSIFVSRVDVYTDKKVTELSSDAQGKVGILNAKRIWADNRKFWAEKNLKLTSEMIFASTGTKKAEDPKDLYVETFAGSDIQTNPPALNDFVEGNGKSYSSHIEELPSAEICGEIDRLVDYGRLEEVLMEEGLAKFADPQKSLLALIAEKRKSLSAV